MARSDPIAYRTFFLKTGDLTACGPGYDVAGCAPGKAVQVARRVHQR
jgi:hypothetical protein